jgi:predicted Holliday junction resolvase-like endonuclease
MKLIIILLVIAGLYFAYVNIKDINKKVENSVKQTTEQLQNQKTIKSVSSGREKAAGETDKAIENAF